MADEEMKLARAPIIEAILDLECDMPPGQDVAALEIASRERFKDHYPKFRTQLFQEVQVEAKEGEVPKGVLRRGVQALQFLQEDEKQLVQVRPTGFSFNRLAPYTGLDDYLPEIERTWTVFIEVAAPLQVRLVRLRYINRIPLPTEEGRLNLDDFFSVRPRLPDEERLNFIGFLNQHTAVEKQTGHQVNIVLSAQAAQGQILPVIFDNCAAAAGAEDPKNWAWILEKIQALRILKNDVFRRTLTTRCLDLFQ